MSIPAHFDSNVESLRPPIAVSISVVSVKVNAFSFFPAAAPRQRDVQSDFVNYGPEDGHGPNKATALERVFLTERNNDGLREARRSLRRGWMQSAPKSCKLSVVAHIF